MMEARPDLTGINLAELVHHGGGGQADVSDYPFQPAAEPKHSPITTLPVPDKNTNHPIKKDKITSTTKNFKKDRAYITRITKSLAGLRRSVELFC